MVFKDLAKDFMRAFLIASGCALVALVFVFLGFVAIFTGMMDGMCGNDIFQEIYSPNQQYKAVISESSCGATTGISTDVTILRTDQELSEKTANPVFMIDEYSDWTQLDVIWLDDHSVQITYDPGYEIIVQESTYRNFFYQIDLYYISN